MERLSTTYDNWADLLEVWNSIDATGDAVLYKDLATEFGGRTVELGIGNGRIAQVVGPDYGVDISPVMLARCRKRLQEKCPRLIHGEIENYVLPEPATFSYLPQNTISNIRPEDRTRVFLNILANTGPEGHFAFDAIVPDLAIIRQRSHIPVFCGRSDSSAIYMVEVLKSTNPIEVETYVLADQLNSSGDVAARRYYLPMTFHYITADQVIELVKTTGWSIEHTWSGFEKEAFTADSKTQVWLLRKATTL